MRALETCRDLSIAKVREAKYKNLCNMGLAQEDKHGPSPNFQTGKPFLLREINRLKLGKHIGKMPATQKL